MAWTISFSPRAKRELDKLDPQVRRRILKFLYKRVLHSENPRLLGEPLQGDFWGKYIKFRVGDYRVIAKLYDDVQRVGVMRAGHRREVYRIF